MAEQWVPKFPDIARDLRDRQLSDAERTADESDPSWLPAPASSHLHGFRFDDARASRVLRIGGYSYIRVRFKDPKSGGVASRYTYSFADPGAAADWWGRLSTAAQPGKVVNEMILAGIPYEKDY